MMKSKRGLGDSIWASRGKAQHANSPAPSAYRPRTYQPTSSVITPATPRPPSPAKTDSALRPAANTDTPASTPAGAITNNGSAAAPRSGPSAQQEFKRYIQIVRRLKWKLPYLSHGYHHAIARPGDPLYGGETDAEEAELMFKLDFYEYYMLLERALVHLMGVFGITVSRDGWVASAPRRANGAQQATHTYHQNVIAALEREDNPLHEALGTGEVLFHLSRAKELRNRWKYAEEGARARANGEVGRERAGTAPLESYDLDKIFRYVFAGFDAGYAVAERRVAEEAAAGGGRGAGGGGEEMEEDEYDFMVEAMDWEAV
ncbi:fungal specific transcription factor [Colletotrichum tofieldiae]|uniref:Fungal specific transcription factor n=1 Tax=Colletotrichum tofieldiae TaxID=708197 RepID=A0A166VWC7_9PEZI|nr:fungal specific transcription factor [Colletotrichum tofieldiae]GKT66833.1 fungal specific transcription factor [Colletotrichum tofieldiae]GKT71899.1 fungal specific transcription factor [Colletotrichum tofieldiae]